ncbi:membrane metallo-endopeptidase-like 1 [Drosophila busckii]|uniref:membrane metallo-endopeptidase-like 1 n=1 Tax=Drosophila busckii TaxID=30019 RepID=UPI001432AFD7|nr:membrane metallo-endopeptidase-like 1 [Drosophila busckii]
MCCILNIEARVINHNINKNNNTDTQLLQQILSYVNESVAPCDDFYQYACGKWHEGQQLNSYNEIVGMLDHRVNERLVTLLEQLEQRKLQPDSLEAKMLSFYRTCRQSTNVQRYSKHYLELVPPNAQITWPQFVNSSSHWAANKFHWLETLARLRRYGMNNVLFKLDAQPALKNSSSYVLMLDRPNFESSTQRLRVLRITNLMLQSMGYKGSQYELARSVAKLELTVRELAERTAIYDAPPGNYEELSLAQLELYVGGKWRKYLELLLEQRIPANYKLYAYNVDYLVGLMRLLADWDAKVLASYLMLRFVQHLQFETMDSDERIECAQDVRRNMELAANWLYAEHFLPHEQLQPMQAAQQQLFEQLRAQFLLQLNSNRLQLSTEQRQLLREKILNISLNIGNMPQVANRQQFVRQFYADLQLIDNQDYALNHLRLLEFRTRRWFEQLQQPASATNYFYISDSETAYSSSPYFMLRQNVVILPYGILQSPIWAQDSHDIFKYSLFGFMLAHELMHGFESQGLLYDTHGNFNKLGVQISQSSSYADSVSCLLQNETDYVQEREADIAGIRLAYDLYFGLNSHFNQSQVSFTQLPLKQLFFLNVAQFFCGNAKSDSFVDHDSDELRLRQMLINFTPFAEAFGCQQDRDKMHPADKCQLW